ncbi:MAG: MFS transporter [Elusimicrobia bacterium GWA2_56_46]|nr:MAG: MFS transporter [Elusimicrobia bacterium GWA2_56_46]OGR54743.1 MAG: MFS transporter [Elusimicrobia bacterium GWC2_56_31]HBB67995.1 MFS transporter [Elusimicrobiota bacterium]HBW23467.1 MFS transporter [Elusimicrobiota bacterium]
MTEVKEESFIGKFMVLKGAVRELWLIFGTKILTIIAYSLVNSTLVLWLSSDLGFSDQKAGVVIAVWSSLLTISTVMVGSLVDAVGIRKSLLTGFGLCVFGRFVMAFFAIQWIAVPFGLFPLALGEALQTPVMVAAIRRFSTTRQRSIAFSIYYSMMNVGFAAAAWTFDKVRAGLGEYGHYAIPFTGIQISTYQTIILLGLLFTIPNLLITYFALRAGVEATDEGVQIRAEEPKYPGVPFLRAMLFSFRDALRDWARIFSSLWIQPAFYRFLAFFGLVVFVKLILYHMYYTFPKFAIRELGEGAPIGHIFGLLNAVIVVILAPVVGALTQKFSAYKAVVIGTAITALSVFFMAAPPALFQSLADGWLGNLIGHTWLGLSGPVHPLYVAIVLCVVMYSIGESFYSPRLYEYPAAIAPKGQEGSYLALSMLPYFVAKFFVGSISGFLLARYCPAEGPRDSQTIWLIVGLMALITPVGLLLARRYIQVHEAGRE